MKTPKVRLYIRVRLKHGHYSFLQPVWNRNYTLRARYALVAGKPEHHPEGGYYLRFLRNGKRIWQPVGADADVALVSLRNAEHELEEISLGRSTPASGDVRQCDVGNAGVQDFDKRRHLHGGSNRPGIYLRAPGDLLRRKNQRRGAHSR